MPRNMSVICCCVTCTALQGEPRPCTQICACVLHTWMSVLSLLERSSACAHVWRMTSLLCARNRSFRDIAFLESCHKTTHPLLRLLSSCCHMGCSCRECTEMHLRGGGCRATLCSVEMLGGRRCGDKQCWGHVLGSMYHPPSFIHLPSPPLPSQPMRTMPTVCRWQ